MAALTAGRAGGKVILADGDSRAGGRFLSSAEHIDGELARIAGRLEGLRDQVEKATLKRYDGLRKHFVLAAATLAGSRCDGCHLDLSAAEIDILRDDAAKAESIAECPQCGRLLVV